MNCYKSLMSEVISLAKKGRGLTSPNPLVGSIIYNEDSQKVEGRGFHVFSGGPHAEVNAVQDALLNHGSVEGRTLLTNLEPCCHRDKKTPPCTELIIKHKIKKVVIGALDPNIEVSGNGVDYLKENGVEVIQDVLNDECISLNEIYNHTQRLKRPFIGVKIASSLDGKVSLTSGESKYITCPESRDAVHDLRYFYDAVMVGVGTIIKDDPILNIRRGQFKEHRKSLNTIIVGRLSGFEYESYRIFNSENRIIFLNNGVDVKTSEYPFKVFNCSDNLPGALRELIDKGIFSILVEPGPKLLKNLIDINHCDKFYIHQSTSFIGKGRSYSDQIEIKNLSDSLKFDVKDLKLVGRDIHIEGYI